MIPKAPGAAIAAAMAAIRPVEYSIIGPEILASYGGAELGRYTEGSWGLAAALPYDPRPRESERGVDELSVGAFAAWNRYATLSRLLKEAASLLAERYCLGRSTFRVAVNSKLPEKALAAASGLGFIGRSGLLVSHAFGPACVLGLLFFPPGFPSPGSEVPGGGGGLGREVAGGGEPDLGTEWRLSPGRGCGACRACEFACPTGAIAADPLRPPALGACIQFWASHPGEPPAVVAEAWGRRLYGCDDCVAACPGSAAVWMAGMDGLSPSAAADSLATERDRRPGAFVPLSLFECGSDEELRAHFRKTALGMSWMPPALLRRNAVLANRNISPTKLA